MLEMGFHCSSVFIIGLETYILLSKIMASRNTTFLDKEEAQVKRTVQLVILTRLKELTLKFHYCIIVLTEG